MERRPKPGEFYRHFKNKLYQIVTIAAHSETGEELVIYQALYGDYGVYARPLSMFISEVDHEKYPEVMQKYRFERIETGNLDPEWNRGCGRGQEAAGNAAETVREEPKEELHPLLLSFVEAETIEKKLEILAQMNHKIGQKELDVIYIVLDMVPVPGEIWEQTEAVKQYLLMQKKYDGARLR